VTPRRRLLVVAVLLAVAVAAYLLLRGRASTLVLTGIVTTDNVIVSPQIGGQLERLLVKEGDSVVRDQLLAVIAPAELAADSAFYAHSAEASRSQVEESGASLRYQERQSTDQIHQADANLAASLAQQAEAAANLENARLILERNRKLSGEGVVAASDLDQSRTAFDAAKARLDALGKQVEAQRAALAMARSTAEQVTVRRSELSASVQQGAAADAQRKKADVRLAYTELRSPIAGIVDVRAARAGEVVTAGQPIVTLLDPDDLWVRVDVEETYVDAVHVGDKLTVRLPSGAEREGSVFFRGVDAAFATQRDVSRTKRDIKTFELRLRLDNKDRALAVGMTARVLLPVKG
jgi:HlyD family secretion protein